MKFSETPLAGAWLIDLQPHHDERGFFARSFCAEEFEAHGLPAEFPQCNISHNKIAGTLRGMHWQAAPYGESKLVRCTAGAILDVIVDLRPESRSYREHFRIELSATNRSMLCIPQGFAHGFQTLANETEVFYQMSAVHAPEAARGFCWNDPEFAIAWPQPVRLISDRDRALPPFSQIRARHESEAAA